MTELQLRNKVKDQAVRWMGLSEPTTYWPIIEVWNAWAKQHGGYIMTKADPWCAAYASAVFIAEGLAAIIPPEVSCGRMVAEAQKRGLWIEDDDYLPAITDLILYDWQDSGRGDNKGEPDHVGVVIGVTGGTIYVAEGNCSDAVRLITRTRGQQYIRGYIVPDFKSVVTDDESDEDAPQEPEKPADEQIDLGLPTIRRGDKGRTVLAMQAVLIALGYRCGWYGSDGDFGAYTYAALVKFQNDVGLEPDGVCGPATWYALMIG